jgi:hypothetical protein
MNAYITAKRKDGGGKKLAISILSELAGIYKTTTEPYTRNDGGVWVLDKNTCPAVVIECGFINNKQDLSFITNPVNQEKVARAILKGLVRSADQKELASMVPIDTIPRFTISGKISEIAPGFTITVEDLGVKNAIHEYKEAPGLVVINGTELSFEEARKRLNGATVTKAEMTTIAPGDDAAIQQYGEAARKGVIVISNGFFTQPDVEFIPGPVNIKDSFGTIRALIVIDNIPSDKWQRSARIALNPSMS